MPFTTPSAAIFSTFSSVVSVKVARSVISEPVTVSYRPVASAQNSARVAACAYLDWSASGTMPASMPVVTCSAAQEEGCSAGSVGCSGSDGSVELVPLAET